ncbi:L-threonylcarbamoyladenylate synthase [Limnobacter sp.]|uniref:L-threonylcarbamoyladenylate synthase n=1 Tax=Limnobacter sp. TaxID=2003368 RepID=UPI003511A739
MAQYFNVHPENPQARLCKQAAELINSGGIAAIPTDSCYALVCHLDDKAAVERLRRLKGISEKQHLALLCKDLSDLGSYAKVSNVQYRLLKSVFPGPYTFILEATKEVPKRVSHPSKKSIGLRVPAHPVVQEILSHTEGALIASTLQLAGMAEPARSGWEAQEAVGNEVDLIVDDGLYCGAFPTTVIDWTAENPLVVRVGAGPLSGALEPVDIDEQESL